MRELAGDDENDYELELEKPDTNRKMMKSPREVESSQFPNTSSKFENHSSITYEADKNRSMFSVGLNEPPASCQMVPKSSRFKEREG